MKTIIDNIGGAGQGVLLTEFSDLHKVNRNEAVRRWKMGLISGKKTGKRDSSVIIEAPGQKAFYTQFKDAEGFTRCDHCPHEVKPTQP